MFCFLTFVDVEVHSPPRSSFQNAASVRGGGDVLGDDIETDRLESLLRSINATNNNTGWRDDHDGRWKRSDSPRSQQSSSIIVERERQQLAALLARLLEKMHTEKEIYTGMGEIMKKLKVIEKVRAIKPVLESSQFSCK